MSLYMQYESYGEPAYNPLVLKINIRELGIKKIVHVKTKGNGGIK